MFVDKDGNIAVTTVVRTVANAVSGYFVGKAIANYFNLTGWKRKLCIGASSALMTVIGWFKPLSIYNAIKAAIATAASAFLTKKGYTISRDMFNHAIYGYRAPLSKKIKDGLISKIRSISYLQMLAVWQISVAKRSKKSSFTYSSSYEILGGDLYYCLQHFDYKIYGKKVGNRWKIRVRVSDTYDFNEFSRVLRYGLSLGNAANDLGYVMQRTGLLCIYDFSVTYMYYE